LLETERGVNARLRRLNVLIGPLEGLHFRSPHPGHLSRAECLFSTLAAPVAQTCSLLYRRFLTCHLPAASKRSADYKSAIRQIKPNFVVDLCRNTLSKFR